MAGYFYLLILVAFSCEVRGCCEFNGKLYQVGETLNDACLSMQCSKLTTVFGWKPINLAINSTCRACMFWNDPHITTFDHSSTYYDFHGTCSYSVAEYVKDWKKPSHPLFGVYGNFRECYHTLTNRPSCLHITTYQVNTHLSVDIDHTNFQIRDSFGVVWTQLTTTPSPVSIGNVNYPLLAWRNTDGCIWMLGPDLVLYVCEHSLHVYASTKFYGLLGGLCGYFNGDWKDDHRSRDGAFNAWEKYPKIFPVTWLVSGKVEEGCSIPGKEIVCTLTELNSYREQCSNAISGKCKLNDIKIRNFIEACASDACANPDDISFWITVATEVCVTENLLKNAFIIIEPECPLKYGEECSKGIRGSCKLDDIKIQKFIEVCAKNACNSPDDLSRWISSATRVCVTEYQLGTGSKPSLPVMNLLKLNATLSKLAPLISPIVPLSK